ncbi:thermonuclease family protein [Sinorhizobium kummerowiae]|uniref:Thermonuclease family protein n=1 Tax=Sinorhizobium kummerowiae TaxID=158892 RepID=A0ABY8T8R4_9HYPH|nr:thermonuclease family protein [Sinorhizobium kummerowiae]WHS94232.1 thermonuclease family protein [Sinorhizobium kummerowiae]WRW46160.1 thermonuclease family protein [Sinorhizobium kummerowiae]
MQNAPVAVLFVLLGSPGWAASSPRVVDGDTIVLNGIVYRLHGIDAPEAGQKCSKPNGKSWECGKAAISALEELVLEKAVDCDDRGQDGYGRTIGVCKVGSEDINAMMVATGHAWAFRKYSTDYAALEDQAHSSHIGIWITDNQTTPWDYRAEKWTVGLQEAPDGCPIKGNISENGHIYHTPWSPWYKKTKVHVDEGERWFCDEAEAIKAGWRAPYWGR